MAEKESMERLSTTNLPTLLKEIPDPPTHLCVKGSIPSEKEYFFLCVVGSRRYSDYGKKVCEYLIKSLEGHLVVIVSGLALGIDSIAHKAALQANLKTIAVPGSGLDESVLYPRTNLPLSKAILAASGALISESEPNERATPCSFPKRNRIMAGLSHATLIIEAGEKSGTLITARLALEYNRDVLVVLADIFRESSKGSNTLLRLGATPISSRADLYEALALPERESEASQNYTLSVFEKQIYNSLREPLSRNSLADSVDLPITTITITLTTLEMKGLIVEEEGKLRRTS